MEERGDPVQRFPEDALVRLAALIAQILVRRKEIALRGSRMEDKENIEKNGRD